MNIKGKQPMTRTKKPTQLHETIKKKAQNFRQNSRSRAIKLGRNYDDLPSSGQIAHWMIDKIDFKTPRRPFFTCNYTDVPVYLKDAEIDHIVPISQGGGFDIENMCITSKRMNAIKSDMTPEGFRQLLLFLEQLSQHDRKSIESRLYAGNRKFFV